MSEAHPPVPIGAAPYRIVAPIGSGGMGAVYRAIDRLTGQMVALKRVEITPERLAGRTGEPDAPSQQDLLALAHEFRTLAALRHPHSISVLDHGFDERRDPFFTMELLPAAQTLPAAGPLAPALADDAQARSARQGAARAILTTLDEVRRWAASAV